MAVFKAAKASLEECYEHIRTVGKAVPSVIKRIVALEDFSKYSKDYINLVCRTPGMNKPNRKMLTENEECDVLVIQNHIPFPEKWNKGTDLDYRYKRQLESMFPRGANFELTSLVKFPPEAFRHPTSGKLLTAYTATQIKGWLPYLLNEIDIVKPKVIVAMSTDVIKLLGLKMNAIGNRGEVHISPLLDLPVVITLHPKVLNMIRQTHSGGMWGDDYYSVIRRDLYKARDLATGKLKLLDLEESVDRVSQAQITVCKSLNDVWKWTRYLLSLPPKQITSWDLETNSLDPWWIGTNRFGEEDKARILTSQVGYRHKDGSVHAIVFPLWHRDNTFYDPDEAFEIHKRYLLRDSSKVGHNIQFDICFLAVTTGIRLVGTILDTMLALHSLDSGIKGCYSLKVAVFDYLLESGLGGYENLLMLEDNPDEVDARITR